MGLCSETCRLCGVARNRSVSQNGSGPVPAAPENAEKSRGRPEPARTIVLLKKYRPGCGILRSENGGAAKRRSRPVADRCYKTAPAQCRLPLKMPKRAEDAQSWAARLRHWKSSGPDAVFCGRKTAQPRHAAAGPLPIDVAKRLRPGAGCL